MTKWILVSLLLASLPAFAVKSVDQLTCAQAVDMVNRTKRYWVQTRYDGIIPIYPVTPTHIPPNCPPRTKFYMHMKVTLDNDDCWVGYSCDYN